MAWRLGVDTGGTFTDLVLFAEDAGEIYTWKTASTPHDPSAAILKGVLDLLTQRDLLPMDITFLGHGTTVATNALLEGRSAVTGLLTTQGFEDMLEIGRQTRPHLYDLYADKPLALVPGRRRLGVPERLDFQGKVVIPLDETAARKAIRLLRAQGAQAVAICFLHSWLNPQHEQRVQTLVTEEFPEAYVVASSDVLPEIREYERLSTTVLSASLGPVVAHYMDRLQERLQGAGFQLVPQITQSNGGIMSVQAAKRRAVETAFSGPAAGVIGAAAVGNSAGFDHIISLDMGGTSADVAVVEGGRPKMTTSNTIGSFPARILTIEVDSVGAGGGSIASVDTVGGLTVGPRSAGAVPGPACYGRGGSEPTVTDAHVVLGHIGSEGLLRGKMGLDVHAAHHVVASLAEQLRLTPYQMAQGILHIANANMLRLIRKLSVARGYDPRDYVLLAFGGCGPLHAADLAEELGLHRVLVPEGAGVLSALGQLLADVRADFVCTTMRVIQPAEMTHLEEIYTALETRAVAWLEEEGVPQNQRVLRRSADARYLGQNWELLIDVPSETWRENAVETITRIFHTAHRQRYTYDLPDRLVEVVNCRVTALGHTPKPKLATFPEATASVKTAQVAVRPVFWEEAPVKTVVYTMDRLAPGHVIDGPAIIEQFTATIAIRPGDVAQVDQYRNVIIQLR
jgi:N-methylhydantoinase A